MSDAKLWVDEANYTATIAGTNVSHTMPLWVFDVMRDIIGAEAEKKVEVTHHDFDVQQNLLDKHRAENAKLQEMAKKLYGGYMGGRYMISCRGCEHAYEDCGGYVPLDPDYCVFSDSDRYVGCWKKKRLEAEMRELGIEVD